ncbi:CsbD family protein [Synechococcus sp. CCY9202]|nr:CsbD family protein [Synechococcus sp. CCY9202]
MAIHPRNLIASLVALALMISTLLIPLPAMAMASDHVSHPIVIGTMSNRMDATAKDAEGKLESTYGELTGDTGHQIKGKAKQVQASAMNTAEDMKQGAKSVARNVRDAAGQMADDLS